MRTPEQALAYARRYTTYRVGMCLHAVQTFFDSPHKYPDAYTQAKAVHLYPGTPPPGVPVFYGPGTGSRYGHVAISVGGGRIRSTDCPSDGRVGETDLNWPQRRWGHNYIGWARNIGGVDIPGAPLPGQQPQPGGDWSKGDVYQDKLHPGQEDSDSVRRLQWVLNQWSFKGGVELPITGLYGPQTASEVAKFQTQVCGDAGDGAIGPKQTDALFTKGGPWTIHR
jgi:hypothetical protein